MKIGIIGVGMVGGALSEWMASQGHDVLLHDPAKGLTNDMQEAEYVFVCVPTPYDVTGYNLTYLQEALNHIPQGKIVIIKCTVLPGTTEKLQEEYPHLKLLHNPEFLTESSADQDMAYPDRQIVGYTDKSYTVAKDVMLLLPLSPYERIVKSSVSEAIKSVTNCFLCVKNTFANQVYDICESVGIDYEMLREALAADKRIERTHLDVWHKFKEKGHRGYGGKCLPKDSKAFIQFAKQNKKPFTLLEATDEANEGYHDAKV